MFHTLVVVLVVAGAAGSINAQSSSTCNSDNACYGRNVLTGDGRCVNVTGPCDDGQSCTTDTCSFDGICTRTVAATGCDKCVSSCTPDCAGKLCGNNGCGGVCGTCPTGTGCNGTFQCVAGATSGSCSSPMSLGFASVTASINFTVSGDTSSSQALDQVAPLCNYRSASPELFYTFTIPAGKSFGYEFRTTGYDTVLAVMKGFCRVNATVSCNDDATPPGDYGSSVSGMLSEGTYFIQVDGFDSAAKGVFTLKGRFIEGCRPTCDGSFCGSDGCGFSCGACGSDQTCKRGRCYNTTCTPRCGSTFNRSCGEDGCGGSCGACSAGFGCVHESVTPDAAEIADGVTIPASYCKAAPVCNRMAPTCSPACGATSYCASNCTCVATNAQLSDFVVDARDARDDVYLQQIVVTENSCLLVEQCVGGTGTRNVIRFTTSTTNQGNVAFIPPTPKNHPESFQWGTCHQHYHYSGFMSFSLIDGLTKKRIGNRGSKNAFCLEDTRRDKDGPNIPCEKKYECGNQGLQPGWTDTYGWSLDCSWIDVTNMAAGSYILMLEVNPERRIVEASYTNNRICVAINVPAATSFSFVPTRLEGNTIVACPSDIDAAPLNASAAGTVTTLALVFLTLMSSILIWV